MEKKVVSAEENKILKKMFWNSHLVFANFNMTKMEANGFTMTMAPAVESIYGDDIEGKKAAYARHQSFFNTHAVAFNFIATHWRRIATTVKFPARPLMPSRLL